MPRTSKRRVDKLAPGKITTELMIDELRAKIQLAEYENKATFERNEQEKKSNFTRLLSERRKNKLRLHGHGTIPDSHNISYAFDKKQPIEKRFIIRKTMGEAIQIQDNKVCEAIKRYNLKVHEKEQKMEQVRKLTEELSLMKFHNEQRMQEEMNSPIAQNIRILENRLEKLKMKYSSAELIYKSYHKILDHLKEETQNYPWRLDELEKALLEHQRAYTEAITVKQEAQHLVEKSIQNTKNFHEEYFDSKKVRDKMLASIRKEVDKAHKEVKGSDKPKALRGVVNANPMQEIINKEAEESTVTQHKYEQQRRKRVEYEGTASFLKDACKVSSKEEILPAITQQHEVERALQQQIEALENQKAVLKMEEGGVSKEYQRLKYYGEKRISDGMRKLEAEGGAVDELKKMMQETIDNIKKREALLNKLDLASKNFFMILQKYRLDVKTRQSGQFDKDFVVLTEKLEMLCEKIEPHGKVVDFLENNEFLDFMEDTLPKANTRVDVRGEDEEGADVFEDEAKNFSNILGRDEIKRASQKIIEKNQGKQRRKKN